MNTSPDFKLPDFNLLKSVLSDERNALVKIEEEEYVRSIQDAESILKFISDIVSELSVLFEQYPSLVGLFNEEYIPFKEFIARENIFRIIFLEDCLFPEKELFFFNQKNDNIAKLLHKYLLLFKEWSQLKEQNHKETQVFIKENFDFEIKQNQLKCQCTACTGAYRNELKEIILKKSIELLEQTREVFIQDMQYSLENSSNAFANLKKNIDSQLHKVRYRLRRRAYINLEGQIKALLKKNFLPPAEASLHREKKVLEYLKNYLLDEGFNNDLVDEKEFKKFFSQLQLNLWRHPNYILREFQKIIRSLIIFKRKDISGKILQNYLGEFWIHSQARILKRKIIYHMGPTNSGKTYHAIEALAQAEKGCYLAPLRLLAAELFDTMNAKGIITTLLTGEEVIEVEGATHYSSTIEMARLQERFDCCVIDEIQMITDPQRGWAWTRALINIFAQEIHICGDGSVLDLVRQIVELCGDALEIKNYERMTELKISNGPISLSQLNRSDALVVFSRRNALKYKRDLESLGFKVSIVYGRLSPEVRREQARKFDNGETDIIVSTDAIAMGMNLPIKRIVFSTLTKFIDSQEIPISKSEVKQISGRAGRYKRFPVGEVTTLTKVENGTTLIKEAIHTTLSQQTKCMVGPDLDIFAQVNNALTENNLKGFGLSEFLRLFNTMTFKKPFYCVDLKEMIELAEMVEDADSNQNLSMAEIFGFSCAPVNLGLIEHIQYYVWILNNFVHTRPISHEPIDHNSSNIDYLETSIKCVELFQWLARHFNNKNFSYSEETLLNNKIKAVERLNQLLGEKTVFTCSSCGVNLPENSKFPICDNCFKKRRFPRKRSFKKGSRKFSNSRKKSVQNKTGTTRSTSKSSGGNRPYKKNNRRKKSSSRRRHSKKF